MFIYMVLVYKKNDQPAFQQTGQVIFKKAVSCLTENLNK